MVACLLKPAKKPCTWHQKYKRTNKPTHVATHGGLYVIAIEKSTHIASETQKTKKTTHITTNGGLSAKTIKTNHAHSINNTTEKPYK